MPPAVADKCADALLIIASALGAAGPGSASVLRAAYYVSERADLEPCWQLLRTADFAWRTAAIVAVLLDPAMKIEIEVKPHRPCS